MRYPSGRTMFVIVVIGPLVLISGYYLLLASDRYVSEASFTIRENSAGTQSLNLGFLNVGHAAGRDDEMIMEAYLRSNDLLEELDGALSLRDHYATRAADLGSRLSSRATREEFFDYYRKHLSVRFDRESGLIAVEVQAFEREFAKQLLELVLAKAEDFVNSINQRLARAQERFAEEQLRTAQDNLRLAKQQLVAFQNENGVFNPEQEGQSLTAIMDMLQADLIKERAALKQLLSYQNPGAPQVLASQERIKALAQQLEDEKGRLVGNGTEKLNELLSRYTDLALELEFAKDAYASMLATLSQSRAEASKKAKHLVVVSAPSLADEAKYPNRPYILGTATIVLLLLYGILRMILATVREHQD